MKNRLIRLVVIFILGLGIAAAIATYQIQNERSETFLEIVEKKPTSSIVSKNFGGPFTLTNQDGERVTEKDFEEKWRLIYFGFTYCPAICPTELQKIATALNIVGEKGENITPIFISVDPERDTVAVMKDYISLFHPRLIGLTGSVKDVEQAKKEYKIYSAKVQDETMSDYTVDHSSFIYLMDPENNLHRIFKTQDSAKEIADYIENTF